MNILAKAVRFDADSMWVDLSDGRTLGVPLAWFPRLLDATPEQRETVEVAGEGLHWQVLDEDISIAGLLDGRGDQTKLAGAMPHSRVKASGSRRTRAKAYNIK